MRIGILGGSFDPIHVGHLIIAAEAHQALGLSKVLFIPANIRPHKRQVHSADARSRHAMVKAALRGCPQFEASDIELRREGISYTIDTLREIRRIHPPSCCLYFIIGGDTIAEIHTWKDIHEVAQLCTFVLAGRPGADMKAARRLAGVLGADALARMRRNILRTPFIGVSSTDIRERVRQGRTISHLVPRTVESYILRHGLYRD